MRNPESCVTCGRPYRHDLLKKCPGCGYSTTNLKSTQSTGEQQFNSISISETFDASRASQSSRQTSTSNVPSRELQDLIRAQNRTTHAVRSLAITFVAAPIISSVALVVVALAVQSQNAGAMIVAGGGTVIVLLMVLFKSLDELAMSKVS